MHPPLPLDQRAVPQVRDTSTDNVPERILAEGQQRNQSDGLVSGA